MSIIRGFKITRTDGTTYGGYRWPLPMPGERVRVEALFPTQHDDPCPCVPGDGLCVALTAAAASSGGIPLSNCIGLELEYDEADILAVGDGKCRVRAVNVVGVFDMLALIRAGFGNADLAGAYLAGAYLAGADLAEATLTRADLYGANLAGAYLARADLAGANLAGADLYGANLVGTNLAGADLAGANLARADLAGASLAGANLAGANLAGATLYGANLAGVTGLEP